ncbi:MAG: hypothetical protein VXX69_06135 [Pseudomonadota bacterium]|nr:hypothetical protein [Pseudomonadota bacterium]
MKFNDHMAGGESVDDLVGQEDELGALDVNQHCGRSRAPVDDILQFRGIRLAANIHPFGNPVELYGMADALSACRRYLETDGLLKMATAYRRDTEIAVGRANVDEGVMRSRKRDKPVGGLLLIETEQLCGGVVMAPILCLLHPEAGKRPMGDNAAEHRKIAGGLFDLHGFNVAKHAHASQSPSYRLFQSHS